MQGGALVMELQELSPEASHLKDLFDCDKPDIEQISAEILSQNISPTDLAYAFISYLDDNIWEYADLLREKSCPTEDEINSLRTAHSPEILRVLIEHKMDLNACFNTMPVLDSMAFIDIPHIPPILEKMALENGCDGNAVHDVECFLEFLDGEISFSLMEEHLRYRVEYLFTMYMIGLGYGCTFQDGTVPVEVLDGFDLSNFKEYQNYGVESFKNESDGRTLYRFYEKASHRIVVIY